MSTANGFYLKLRTKDDTVEIRNSIDSRSSFLDLLRSVSDAAGIQVSNLKILSGFPRKALVFPSSETLEKCGIRCGDTLFVTEEENFNSATPAAPSDPSPRNVPSDSSTRSVRSTSPSRSVPASPVRSVPPVSAKSVPSASPARNIPSASAPTQPKSHITDNQQRNGACGILMKKVVPSDNSCLFTSFEFVVSGKLDTSASSYIRQLVATVISSQSEEYNEAILGQPNESYCKWIMNPNSWGGAIELAVLSDHFGFEIAVVNSITGLISRFGEDKHYSQRVFLLFDGIHYDPLYMDFMQIDKIQTIFPTEDTEVYQQAEQLAEEAKSSRQFTDVNQFKIRCTVCNSIFVGQLEAQKHAEKTAHTSFDEVNS